MYQKKIVKNVIIILVIVFVGITGYFVLFKKSSPIPYGSIPRLTAAGYQNNQYGFSFSLPVSWQEYSIVTDKWEGQLIDATNSAMVEGPKILIRHPKWTTINPRQDIPIMLFTLVQWNLIQQEKLIIGAAPIRPSELGRNVNYVFALPARYNYAFLTGYEEVTKILESQPLHASIPN